MSNNNNRTEFQRDQITRKSVFVRNKRTAPVPPSSPQLSTKDKNAAITNDEVDGGKMSVRTPMKISLETLGIQQGNGTSPISKSGINNVVATENKINLCKTKYMTTERPHFSQQQQQTSSTSTVRKEIEKWDNNKLHIQEQVVTPKNDKNSTSTTTTSEDDTSMNMLLQLEKHINKMEFDTRVTSHQVTQSPVTPVLRKPIQYSGMESLLNTGVSNVATEGGIGYLESRSNNDEDDVDVNTFKRNLDVRQSIGAGTSDRKPPSGIKQCRPVQRTTSDTNQMKVVAMSKRNETTIDGKKVSPLPPPRSTLTSNSSNNNKKSQLKDDKYRPTDVKKFVEEHMKSRKVIFFINKIDLSVI